VLSSTTADAAVHYTTDGTTPTAASTLYSNPIAVAASETIKALAVSPTEGTSNIVSAAYVIQPVVNPGAFTVSGTTPSAIAAGNSATSTITVTPTGGFTGSVALTCAVTSPSGASAAPTCSASQPAVISGTGAVTATLSITTQAGTTPGNYSTTVTGTSGTVVETANIAFTVSTPPSFTLSGTAVTITAPGASAASTVTITPSGGYTGSVALTCAVTASPTGATDLPTCLTSQPAMISGSDPVTSTVMINTTAPSSAALHHPLHNMFQFGGGTFAALLLFCLPFRRRKWQSLFALLLFVAVAATMTGCGGTQMSTGPKNSGTTPGSYTVTVTATSGSTSATTKFTVTVS